MRANLDSALFTKLLRKAADKLKGEWLLVGGTLLPAVGINVRSTVDIDLIGLTPAESNQQLELMQLAESLGLPVDSINQTAAFFLKKVGYTRGDLLVLHKGSGATIFRPSLALYWRLKCGRLSETDVEDCRHYMKFCVEAGDPVSQAGLKEFLRQLLSEAVSADKKNRLLHLNRLAETVIRR